MKTKQLAAELAEALQKFVTLDPKIMAKVQQHLEKQGVILVMRGYLQPNDTEAPTKYFLQAAVKPKRSTK